MQIMQGTGLRVHIARLAQLPGQQGLRTRISAGGQ